MTKKSLLIVAHTPSSKTKELASAVLSGSQSDEILNVDVQLRSPFDCDSSDVLSSDAIILFTTENFGYMSGALKDFFERIYYPCLEQTDRNESKPFSLIIRAGLDGTGTNTSVHSITQGLKWREVQPTLLCKGDFQNKFIEECYQHGMTMAAGLDNNIF